MRGPARPRPRILSSCEPAFFDRSRRGCGRRSSSAGLAGCPKVTAADSAVARRTPAGMDRDTLKPRMALLRQLLLEDKLRRPHPARDTAGPTGVHGREGTDCPGAPSVRGDLGDGQYRPPQAFDDLRRQKTDSLLDRRTCRHPHRLRARRRRRELRCAAPNSLTCLRHRHDAYGKDVC
jgi:hypothetical protein